MMPRTHFFSVILFSLLLSGCGGGSGGGSNENSNQSVTDESADTNQSSENNDEDQDVSNENMNQDVTGDNGEDSGTESDDNPASRDLTISDSDYSAGSTILSGISWPYGDIQIGSPIYATFNNPTSVYSIEKGSSATDTVDASDFTPLLTEQPSTGGASLNDIESVRFLEADNTVNRWLMSCDNNANPNGRASVNIYRENNLDIPRAAVPLFNQETVQGRLQTWTMTDCRQISIGSYATATAGFAMSVWVIGEGELSGDSSNSYDFLVRIDMDYNKNGPLGSRIGGIPTLVRFQNIALGEYLSVAGYSSEKAIVASYSYAGQSNQIRILGDTYNQPLLISQQNKFTGSNGFMDIGDIHLWKKNANDFRIYSVSNTSGVYAIQWDATSDQKVGEETYSNGDIQYCTESITGFREPSQNGKLWCHDNTDKGNLLEFEAPAIRAVPVF